MKLLINGRVYKKWRHLKTETIIHGKPIDAKKDEIKRFFNFVRVFSAFHELEKKAKKNKIWREKERFPFEFIHAFLQEQAKFYDYVEEGR